MNLCYLEKNEIVVSFPYDAGLILLIKEFPQPNRRYDPKRRAWVVSLVKYGKINEKVLRDFESFLNENDFKIHVAPINTSF